MKDFEKQAKNLKEKWDLLIIETENISEESLVTIMSILQHEPNCEIFRDYYPKRG